MAKKYKYFIIIGTLLLFTLGVIQSNLFVKKRIIIWKTSESVKWSDFRGLPPAITIYGAAISSNFDYEIYKSSSIDSIKIITIMKTHNSWVKDSILNNGLRHEQYHFNISEIVARKFRKEISLINKNKLTEELIKSLNKKYKKELNNIQSLYDEETDHSLILERQKDWEYLIDSMLISLSQYASPIIQFNTEIKNNHFKYFREIEYNAKLQIIGKSPIDSNIALRSKYYKFFYNKNGAISKIEYWNRNRPVINYFNNVFSIKINYTDSSELRIFYDKKNKRIKNDENVFGVLLIKKSKQLIVKNLDINNKYIGNKVGIYTRIYKLDYKGRLLTRSSYNKYFKKNNDIDGFYIKTYKHDKYDNLTEIANYNNKNELINTTTGIAYSIFKYDINNNLIESTNYNDKMQLCSDTYGISIEKYNYDNYGNKIMICYYKEDETRFISENGVSVSYFKYDKYGNNIKESYFGLNKNLIFFNGEGKVEYDYDSLGRVIEKRNYDAYDTWINDDNNICKTQYTYYNNDKIETVTKFLLDSTQNLIFDRIIHYDYDKKGHIIKEMYFDKNGKAMSNENDICLIKYKYNNSNKLIETSYFNINHTLQVALNNVAIFRYKYDKRGNKIRTSYFDINNKLIETINNIAEDRYYYNDNNILIKREYYDTKGFLTKNANGVESINWEYDSKGNLIKKKYKDSEGKLCINNMGYAILEQIFNDKSQIIETRFYNKNKKLVTNGNNNIAIIKFKINVKGNTIEVAYFNKENILINSQNGYAIEQKQYDSYNRLVKKIYLSNFKRPIVTNFGYASIEYLYDNNSNIIAEIYRDENNELIEDSNGYAIYNMTYNRNGKQINSIGYKADILNLLKIDYGPFIRNISVNKKDLNKLVTYYDNGQKETEIIYINGKPAGIFTSWHSTGEIENKITYKNGKQDGLMLEFYKNGQKKRRVMYKNNSIIWASEKTWFKNGSIKTKYYLDNKIEFNINGDTIK